MFLGLLPVPQATKAEATRVTLGWVESKSFWWCSRSAVEEWYFCGSQGYQEHCILDNVSLSGPW